MLDERLGAAPGGMIAGVLDHLVSAGIDPDAVTLLSPNPHSKQTWIDELPDEFADVKAEVHHAADRKKLAYLATTKSDERIYLNRTTQEADFIIALSAHRHGNEPGETLLVPGVCDEEYQRKAAATPPDIAESMWLVGTPFFVRAIEGANGGIHEVLASFTESLAEANRRRDARWSRTVNVQPEMVLVEFSSPRFEDLANAIANAERVVAPNGKIVVLMTAAPTFPDAMGHGP